MKISSIGIGVLSTALLCGRASAVETNYAAGTRALPLQQSAGTARAMAMGSAVVGLAQGSASLLWNPAALSRMSCTEVGLHHNSGLGGANQEIVIVGTPLGRCEEEGKGGALGGIAASVGYVNYGSFEGRDAAGLPTGSYRAAELSGSLGWGMEFIPGVAGGGALRANKSTYEQQSYNAYTTDLGVLWKVIPAVDLGVAYTNINLGNNIGGAQPASGWRVGAGWAVNRHWLLAASGELQDKAMRRAQLGTEYQIGNLEAKANVLALRAGYQLNYPDPDLSGLTGLTFGLGYTITRSIAVDYAMLTTGELGNSHRLSLTFKFNCPKKEEPEAAVAAPVAAAAAAPMVAAVEKPRERPPIVVKSILLEDSHFDFDKSVLRPQGMAALRENVQILKENPKAMVRVAGYTSMMGTPEYNQLLSERRAAAVEDFLIEEGGIAPSRISTIGFGETRPATYEAAPSKINSPAAKSNMRVLFEITVK